MWNQDYVAYDSKGRPRELQALLDSGASHSVIGSKTVKALGYKTNGSTLLRTANGVVSFPTTVIPISVRGERPVPMEFVISDQSPAVIGLDAIQKFGLLKRV